MRGFQLVGQMFDFQFKQRKENRQRILDQILFMSGSSPQQTEQRDGMVVQRDDAVVFQRKGHRPRGCTMILFLKKE